MHNHRKLNVGKRKELIIDLKKKHHFTVDDVNIELVKSTCILGRTVQDNMKWYEHFYEALYAETAKK